ncbi:MAG: pseudouridine synthase [Gammaproteobacteria bacterium]
MRSIRSKLREERRIGLARALSKQGICSRSIAAELILAGRVRLDGAVVRDPEAPTTARSRISVDNEKIVDKARSYVMLNKPRGLVTTTQDERGRDTVYDCFKDSHLPWIVPVGRLDQASEGLLLFSNDSEWSAALIDPARHVTKTYHVQIDGLPAETVLARMVDGVIARDGETLRVTSALLLRHGDRNAWLEIALTEGRNRHLRRLFEALDHAVLRLIRVAIGPVKLGNLGKGQWRHLLDDERQQLNRLD